MLRRVQAAAWRRWRGAGERAVVVEGLVLGVPPDVLDPVAMRSGALLGAAVADEVRAGERVLDLGTGSGVGGLVAAARGARVVATDVAGPAVAAARANAARNGLAMDVRLGDLFAPVAGLTFDLLLWNPPFWLGAPRSDLDRAFRGPDIHARFADGLPRALADGGRALVVTSTDGDCDQLLARLDADGWRRERRAERRFFGETVTVWRVARPSPPGKFP